MLKAVRVYYRDSVGMTHHLSGPFHTQDPREAKEAFDAISRGLTGPKPIHVRVCLVEEYDDYEANIRETLEWLLHLSEWEEGETLVEEEIDLYSHDPQPQQRRNPDITLVLP